MVTYKDAGVDISKSNEAKERIKGHIKSTFSSEVLTGIGTFGALYAFNQGKYKNPVLVSSTDGVGTKVKLAIRSGKFDTIGQDLVNHCVNDILVMGARPLFFLDYIALGKIEPKKVEHIVHGFAKACKENNCSLIGGETAEMPGIYAPSDFDLAGFIVGVVERDRIIDGKSIQPGDVIIGLSSTGLQTNGYSLANRVIFDLAGYKLEDSPQELSGKTIAQSLMAVHGSYLAPVTSLLDMGIEIKGMAHITGGGLIENIPRILPNGTAAHIEKSSWEVPSIFNLIRRLGNVPQKDMYRTFNMGIGLIIVVDKLSKDRIISELLKMKVNCHVIGKIIDGNQKVILK